MFIDKIIDKLHVKSILDIGCNYEALSNNLEMYIGIDTDKNKILSMRTKNFNKNNKIFFDLDYVRENFPKTDLIIINKYNIRETWILIEKIRQSKAKYFLSPNNLSMEPFYLPDTSMAFLYNNSILYCYEVEDIEFYMEEYSEEISLLRKYLIPIIDTNIKKIYNKFLQHENGETKLIDFLVNSKELNWDSQYYNEQKIVDYTIFNEYIDLLIFKFNQKQEDLKLIYDNLINKDNYVWVCRLVNSYINFFFRNNKKIQLD